MKVFIFKLFLEHKYLEILDLRNNNIKQGRLALGILLKSELLKTASIGSQC